ncbi:hypothetical protein ABVT39_005533, partial [Epinephelus coioides]
GTEHTEQPKGEMERKASDSLLLCSVMAAGKTTESTRPLDTLGSKLSAVSPAESLSVLGNRPHSQPALSEERHQHRFPMYKARTRPS